MSGTPGRMLGHKYVKIKSIFNTFKRGGGGSKARKSKKVQLKIQNKT